MLHRAQVEWTEGMVMIRMITVVPISAESIGRPVIGTIVNTKP